MMRARRVRTGLYVEAKEEEVEVSVVVVVVVVVIDSLSSVACLAS